MFRRLPPPSPEGWRGSETHVLVPELQRLLMQLHPAPDGHRLVRDIVRLEHPTEQPRGTERVYVWRDKEVGRACWASTGAREDVRVGDRVRGRGDVHPRPLLVARVAWVGESMSPSPAVVSASVPVELVSELSECSRSRVVVSARVRDETRRVPLKTRGEAANLYYSDITLEFVFSSLQPTSTLPARSLSSPNSTPLGESALQPVHGSARARVSSTRMTPDSR